MPIIALKALRDNYIWIIRKTASFICVDPGDATPVIQFAKHENLLLDAILITHYHKDHVAGIASLMEHFPNVRLFEPLNHSHTVLLASYRFHVMDTPGHTDNHVCYYEANNRWLFCGDTLFSAGCGRVFNGTIEALYHSIEKLKRLPADTKIFCAHEYTRDNLKFAQTVEPNNQSIQRYLNYLEKNAHLNSLPSSMALEKRINPFLRLNEPEVRGFVSQYDSNVQSDFDCFKRLRQLKNDFTC